MRIKILQTRRTKIYEVKKKNGKKNTENHSVMTQLHLIRVILL